MTIFGIQTDFSGFALEAAVASETAADEGVDSILLVGNIWGESGYYDADVLERDVAKFSKGTRMFQGHPANDVEEPSEKLYGVLGGAARYVASDPEADGKPTLRAPVKVFDDARPWVKARANAGVLGLSHRSAVRYATGTREGRTGRILAGIDEVLSVDFVTRPGAKGRLGVFTESARPGTATDKEGSEPMALSDEDKKDLGTIFAEALKTVIEPVTSALGELKTIATESAKPKALSFGEVSEKITAAKLPEGAVKRLNAAVDGQKDGVTAQFLESEIAREQTVWEEATKAAAAGLADGTLTITTGEDGQQHQQSNATESKSPRGWGAAKGGDK